MSGTLTMLTIYNHPADHPHHIVLTSWAITSDGPELMGSALCDTVEEARAVPRGAGMFCLGRAPEDDPTVVESWF